MRRKDREITDFNEIIQILKQCDTCRLALFDEEYPYIIPLNFGLAFENDKLVLYFHGAKMGKKMSLIRRCNKAGFEADSSHKLITGDLACDYTMEYKSVCGNGEIALLDEDEKRMALLHLMKQYSDRSDFEFDPKILEATEVFRLTVNEITGKCLKLNN